MKNWQRSFMNAILSVYNFENWYDTIILALRDKEIANQIRTYIKKNRLYSRLKCAKNKAEQVKIDKAFSKYCDSLISPKYNELRFGEANIIVPQDDLRDTLLFFKLKQMLSYYFNKDSVNEYIEGIVQAVANSKDNIYEVIKQYLFAHTVFTKKTTLQFILDLSNPWHNEIIREIEMSPALKNVEYIQYNALNTKYDDYLNLCKEYIKTQPNAEKNIQRLYGSSAESEVVLDAYMGSYSVNMVSYLITNRWEDTLENISYEHNRSAFNIKLKKLLTYWGQEDEEADAFIEDFNCRKDLSDENVFPKLFIHLIRYQEDREDAAKFVNNFEAYLADANYDGYIKEKPFAPISVHKSFKKLPMKDDEYNPLMGFLSHMRCKKYEHIVLNMPKKMLRDVAFIQCCRNWDDSYRVEIGTDSVEKRKIYRKDRISCNAANRIFENLCVKMEIPNLDEWEDVTNIVFGDGSEPINPLKVAAEKKIEELYNRAGYDDGRLPYCLSNNIKDFGTEACLKFLDRVEKVYFSPEQKLFEACIKDELDFETIENLLKEGASPNGEVFTNDGFNNLYGECVGYYYEDHDTPLPQLTALLLKYGLNIEKPAIPYDEEVIDPMWSFHLYCKTYFETFKVFLDNGVSPKCVDECLNDIFSDCVNVDREIDDIGIKYFLLAASYPYVLKKLTWLKKLLDFDNNSYDLSKFRNDDTYITETHDNFKDMYYLPNIIVRNKETGKVLWKFKFDID